MMKTVRIEMKSRSTNRTLQGTFYEKGAFLVLSTDDKEIKKRVINTRKFPSKPTDFGYILIENESENMYEDMILWYAKGKEWTCKWMNTGTMSEFTMNGVNSILEEGDVDAWLMDRLPESGIGAIIQVLVSEHASRNTKKQEHYKGIDIKTKVSEARIVEITDKKGNKYSKTEKYQIDQIVKDVWVYAEKEDCLVRL